ncbi:hypothetical protein ONS95_003813 [Cadophora gregata]|uniref:uncharacterized protein n=1 Tax=Cadophora gregata TaxID=51156 RepID=UPI0026DB62BC|nr:uncharacterized protein ONS95_003813 [Cadophora gregata]KAK0107106.1 hypothetical protein ONS95_003813 [Cadophora gregata]KAK0116791.1 hypothetical protein ONS96_012641 [Cadophora gregata f. sp. sojae]
MRFSAITALCAAPLALAGSLQADLVARGALDSELVVRTQHEAPKAEGEGAQKGGNQVVNHGSSNAQVTEVIIIWINAGNNAQTQTVTTTMPPPAGAPAPMATHLVTVGGAGGLVFSPDQIKANIGDMVIFEFHSQNHTATQSAFTTPCDPLAGGMDTGFMPNPNNTISPAPQVAMQVTVDTPLWFYCRQANHCGKGMTFSINPTANKTQAMFQQMAVAQKGTGAPAVIVGGQPAATAAPPAASPPPPAAAAPPAANAPTMVGGTGQMANGACACSCLCGAAAFPNAAIQGVGAFGGIAGAMPMSALEA